VDVRIIAATNRIEGLGTDASKLRLDLYHRLATVVLSLPPLRERMGDLIELVENLLEIAEPEHGKKIVTEDAWKALLAYAWPGNVRELRGAVARAVALGGDALVAADFFPEIRGGGSGGLMPLLANGDDPMKPYHAMMRGAFEQALATHGSIRAAADYLGIPKSTFADRAKAWGLLPRPRHLRRRRRPTKKDE
jgi:transcriptional regulator with PAS, ATPase and Fis domain